jgi:prolyl-tRNA editing enzyme YbaK/EbsC (Cys-tRNA(Pro) deacylase)
VAPVGLPEGVRVLADAAVSRQEVVYAPTGDGSTALKIRAADLLALTGATVAPLVEPGAEIDLTRYAGEGAWRGAAPAVRH